MAERILIPNQTQVLRLSSINEHAIKGKPFVKVRKIKKQVLLGQNLDQIEPISSKYMGTSTTPTHQTLSKVHMIRLNGLEPVTTVACTKQESEKMSDNCQVQTQDSEQRTFENRDVSLTVNMTCSGNDDGPETKVNEEFNKEKMYPTRRERPGRKPSSLLIKDSPKAERRDSVVAMSTRKMSLAQTANKSKIRKTSFVAPPASTRRKSSLICGIQNKFPGHERHRESTGVIRSESKQIQLDMLLKQSGDQSTVFVNINSVVSTLRLLYPSSTIQICKSDGQCLFEASDKQEKQSSDMPPRNESPMTVFSEKPMIEDVIKEIKRKPNTVTSQTEFCRKMAIFANNDSLNVLLAKQEGILLIIQAIENYKDNINLVKAACQTLLKLTSFSDANCVHIYKANGISLLLELQQLYIDDAELLLIILDILGYFSMSDDTDISNSLIEKSSHTIVLTTMSRHGDNSDIVKQCFFILSHVVQSVDIARSLMFVGGVHVIIGAMQRYKDNNEVLENGCRALGSFAIHDEICMDVVNAGAVTIVLHALQRDQKDEYLLECAAWGLACLTKYDESCEEICNSCALETLVQAMKNFPRKETLQEYSCWTLCNVVGHVNNPFDINTSHQIIEVLLDATGMFIENIDLQEQLLFALSEIITIDESVLTKFVTKDGIGLVIKTMSQYPDHSPIQEHGCRIIGNVAVHESHRLHVETEGGSKVVVSAMLTLETSEEIQEIGCLALTNITANVYKNKITAIKSGCVTAVLNAMSKFGGCEHILLSGLKTICNVIEIDEACYNVIEEGGLNTISGLFSTTKECKDIYLFASNVLSRISSILDVEEEQLWQAEHLLLRIKDLTSDDAESVVCLLRFYDNMLQTEEGYKKVQQKLRIDTIVKWMNTFTRDINIQLSSCKVLSAMALYRTDRCTDIFNAMRNCMTKFIHNSDIQLICCGAIVYIADKNDDCRDTLLQSDAINLVMNAMKAHTSVEKLIDITLMALDLLLKKNATLVHPEHSLNYVKEVMQLYQDNSDIQTHGCNILTTVECRETNNNNDMNEICTQCEYPLM